MKLSLKEIVVACDAKLIKGSETNDLYGFSTDTRISAFCVMVAIFSIYLVVYGISIIARIFSLLCKIISLEQILHWIV